MTRELCVESTIESGISTTEVEGEKGFRFVSTEYGSEVVRVGFGGVLVN